MTTYVTHATLNYVTSLTKYNSTGILCWWHFMSEYRHTHIHNYKYFKVRNVEMYLLNICKHILGNAGVITLRLVKLTLQVKNFRCRLRNKQPIFPFSDTHRKHELIVWYTKYFTDPLTDPPLTDPLSSICMLSTRDSTQANTTRNRLPPTDEHHSCSAPGTHPENMADDQLQVNWAMSRNRKSRVVLSFQRPLF